MAIANVHKEMVAGGKANLVGDKELYNTAAELTRIMGHKNPDKFFNDPDARDPQTGQLLHTPAPPPPNPDAIKAQVALQIAQARAQREQQVAGKSAQLEQAKAQTDALHQHIKVQADVEMAKVKAELDAKLAIIDAHVKALAAAQTATHAQQAHRANMAHSALDLVAAAQAHDERMGQMRDAKADASIPGARKAKDGKHYVPDGARPGKFLMVVPHV